MGWQAELELGFCKTHTRTLLAHRRRCGPLTVQRPFYPEGDVCHVYMLHPPGGVVGGDQLKIQVDLAKQANALITTPGATKFYRSTAQQAIQTQVIKLASQACVEWFPQENIFFPGAKVRLQTRFDLQAGARFAMWEINSFGRPTIDEPFDAGQVDMSLQIWQANEPLLIERLQVDAQSRTFASTLRSQPVNATLLLNGADHTALEKTRCLLRQYDEQISAATLIDEILIVRYLGHSTEMARKLFVSIWSLLRPNLMGRPADYPRIWNT